ncbi:hypothetical protein [Pseudomonas sp.]|jgi:hypothetical protein|uniref:hypothetical protein n=1 Tax=Pseudomonas sp. TaxID=306 RepID=UPI002EDAAA76
MALPSMTKNIAIVSEGIRTATDPVRVRTQTAYAIGYIDAMADVGFADSATAQNLRDDIKVIRNRRLMQLGAPLETTDL